MEPIGVNNSTLQDLFLRFFITEKYNGKHFEHILNSTLEIKLVAFHSRHLNKMNKAGFMREGNTMVPKQNLAI